MQRLFEICVNFLEWIGNTFHITYQQISVYINLYLQGGLLVLSAIPALIVAIIHKSPIWIVATALNAAVYVLGFIWMMVHYNLPQNINYAFDKCVDDLMILAQSWHLSYQQVNLLIFVLGFLLLLGLNLGLCGILKTCR